jgi:hypothetical protein
MSFINRVSKATPKVLGHYLGNLTEGLFDGGLEDPKSFLLAMGAYLILCVLWVVLLGTVSTISDRGI